MFPQGPHRITAGGEILIDDLSTEAATFVENTVILHVRNGQIELEVGGAIVASDPESVTAAWNATGASWPGPPCRYTR